ncbi:uncharacterized protein CMC5_035790 [Chondromyces crocatus]|uniref:Uncharacterized protein n=2 Tax=Chondromyces crocatus TaxID=52 RepID=A0A0K1EFF1_CHOCO|nr:uncharacterized protein CMC5_035790 [Chondromyces crocatus]
MQRRDADLSMSLWHTPGSDEVRVVVAFRSGEGPHDVRRVRAMDLRLCVARGRMRDLGACLQEAPSWLSPSRFPGWIAQLNQQGAEVYTVVSAPGAPEVLALVGDAPPARHLH